MNLLFVCGTPGTPWNLPAVQLPHVFLANLTSENIFETELAYTWEEFGHHDSNRLTYRYARHPTRTIFAGISWGTSGSWWPWRSRGSSLSLIPLNRHKTHHKFALEASTTQKDIDLPRKSTRQAGRSCRELDSGFFTAYGRDSTLLWRWGGCICPVQSATEQKVQILNYLSYHSTYAKIWGSLAIFYSSSSPEQVTVFNKQLFAPQLAKS